MLAKNGLLVVSNPKQISKVLSSLNSKVKNTLYIQLLSALGDPAGTFHPNVYTSVPKYSQTISGIYNQVVTHCRNLDVRVLLSNLKYKHISQIRTQKPIDLVIFDKIYSQNDIDSFVRSNILNKTKECDVFTLDCGPFEEIKLEKLENENVYKHSCLGGTFDRLHVAHKLLLTEAALRATKTVTIGVTEENMQESKVLWELIEPLDVRMKVVEEFLKDIEPELEVNVVSITDPFGPTRDDGTMDLLVVSDETVRGGNKVNEVRQSKNHPLMDILRVDLIDEPQPLQNEEKKISSSTRRMRLLGTLLKPVKVNPNMPKRPYIIGLTGGVASGKSGISRHLKELGAEVIDCDKVGHSVYLPGKSCFLKIRDAFGPDVVGENGEINRAVLGGIVFGNPEKMQQLNSIVWPEIIDEVTRLIQDSSSDVIVIEAAVLLKAGWESQCHEVWTSFVPPKEAVARLMKRNNLTEAQATARLASQPNNKYYLEAANVVFCSLWEVEYTKSQVVKAWDELKDRLPPA